MSEARVEQYQSTPDDYNVFTKDRGRYLGTVALKDGAWYAHVNGVYDPDELGPVATIEEALDLILDYPQDA